MSDRRAAGLEGGGDSVRRNAAFALGSQAVTSVFTAALTLYLVRALGPAGYGTFALAIGIAAILMLPADFGISQSTGRFVAERLDRGADVGAVVAMAVRFKIGLAAVIAVALFLLAAPIADAYGSDDLAWPLRGAAVAMFGQGMMQLSRVVFTATRRISRSFTLIASESAMEFSASVALVLLGAGATGAAFGRAAGYLFGAALGLLLLSRLLGSSVFRSGVKSPIGARQFVGYAGALLIVDGAYALFNQIDVLIIGALLGTTAAGLFSAPMRLVPFLAYPGLAIAQAVAPRLAARDGLEHSAVDRLQRSLRLMILLQALPAVFVLVWAEPIVSLLLGSDYRESVDVLRALAPFIFMIGLGPLVTLTLNYSGEARKRVPIAIVSVAVNAGFDFAFVPSMGIVAGAIGTGIGYGIYVGWHLLICRSSLGLSLGPLALSLFKATIAATPVAALLFGLQAGGLSSLEWVVGLLLGPPVMAAMLLLLREVSTAELTGLLRSGRSLVSRRAR